jgi:hypothetical protein
MYYIIKRTLARKKTTSSTDTFFKVMYQGENIIEDIKKKIQKSDILLWDYNIIEEIERATDLFTIEQQPFKNNSDVQSFLDANILLEKNVFLNTIFLLQDSKNIFECPAQERITILKNVFGLIGVDA